MTDSNSFETYGQNETLISSIRNIIKDYPFESIFKEFLQNADDAGATRFHVILDYRSHPTSSLFCDKMKAWQGPAILIFNDAKFREADFDSLMQIRVGGKQGDNTKIGKHGLGFNSCYHFTDVPSFISGDSIAFLDPQERFLPTRNVKSQRGIKGPIPRTGIHGSPNKDQLAPFDGIEGINFRSTFKGTLFRIPLRQQSSDISDRVFTTDEIFQLIEKIKSKFSSQFIFLRNIEKVEMSYIHVPDMAPLNITSLWRASIIGLDQNVRNKRRSITNDVIQTYQLKIEIIDNSNDRQNEHWIITTGAQQDPEDSQLRQYARQHRLRILGGIAGLLESPKDKNQDTIKGKFRSFMRPIMDVDENQNKFIGRMYSFLSLPDTTHLPVHLNGTWAQGSDRGRLLIEKDDLPDIDHQKLNWNRHILHNFLPKLYCKLLEEVINLYESRAIELDEHPIIKFWPFPTTTKNYPKYAIEYGLKVLQKILNSDVIFQLIDNRSSNENNHMNFFRMPRINNGDERAGILFRLIRREHKSKLRDLLRNNWDDIDVRSDPNLKSMIRSLPIWPMLSNPLVNDFEPTLQPASRGHLLPQRYRHYITNDSKIYLNPYNDQYWEILIDLDVPVRDIYSYVVEDVRYPSTYDDHYISFLKSTLEYNDRRIFQGLKDKACFPTFEKTLKNIDELYDYNNIVFRAIFSDNSDIFLHHDFLQYGRKLSAIGFKNKINQATFKICAREIERLQDQRNPPSDIRYRGFILVDHFYKNITNFNLDDEIGQIRFVPTVKKLDKPYSIGYSPPQTLNYFKDIIHHSYKEVAWSQIPLITEDVVPPSHILQRYPNLGKPDAETVIKHLRFMYTSSRNNNEWKRDWSETFKNNIYKIYKWLDEECNYVDLNLAEYIRGEPLFLNFNYDQDPFNANNWVTASTLVLNSEIYEEGYVYPNLAIYSNMLKSAGAQEVTAPDVEIIVREHDQLSTNNTTTLNFLLDDLDQTFPLHDFTFIVNDERIRTNQYMLATSSKYFFQEFTSGRLGATIINNDVEPQSMRILLCYLYGQSIDDAWEMYQPPKFEFYKDLLKLANDYVLCHLKELMESRLSRLINRSNVEDMKRFAEITSANQLYNFCCSFINRNRGL